jgi:hypothetical protein
MIHPTICPKTPDVFHSCGDSRDVWMADPPLKSWNYASERRVIARYQACAWLDRGERFRWVKNYFDRSAYGFYRWRDKGAWQRWHECHQNATAWREWEKRK